MPAVTPDVAWDIVPVVVMGPPVSSAPVAIFVTVPDGSSPEGTYVHAYVGVDVVLVFAQMNRSPTFAACDAYLPAVITL